MFGNPADAISARVNVIPVQFLNIGCLRRSLDPKLSKLSTLFNVLWVHCFNPKQSLSKPLDASSLYFLCIPGLMLRYVYVTSLM